VLVKFVTGSKSKVKTAHKEKLSTSRYFLWCILVLESFMDVEEVRYPYDALPTSTKKIFYSGRPPEKNIRFFSTLFLNEYPSLPTRSNFFSFFKL